MQLNLCEAQLFKQPCIQALVYYHLKIVLNISSMPYFFDQYVYPQDT